MKSLSFKNISRIDKENMLGYLLDFPLQCKIAWEIARGSNILFSKRNFNKIVFLGMGGSAIGGDLIRAYLSRQLPLPILVLRDYVPPLSLDKDSLVFAVSYSGNTEETISAYLEAKERNSPIIGISSGGELEKLCLEDKNTFIKIPSGLPPRCALGYLGILPLAILEKIGLIENQNDCYQELISILENLKKRLNPSVGIKDNPAKYIASKIHNKLPILYTASLNFDVVVTRFRAQLNENAKTLAISNLFPELNHNEIEGFINLKKILKYLVVIFLKDNQFHPQIRKRMDITSEILKQKDIPVLEINSEGSFLLSRIFSLIYITDFISFYLAILYNTDPTPVSIISYLKKRLKD